MSVEVNHSNHIHKIMERDFEANTDKNVKAFTSGVQARSRDNLNRKYPRTQQKSFQTVQGVTNEPYSINKGSIQKDSAIENVNNND